MDIAALASEKDDELARLCEIWTARVREHNAPNDVQGTFRTGMLGLAYSYARMNVLSFGFQYEFGKASMGQDMPLLGRVSFEQNEIFLVPHPSVEFACSDGCPQSRA